MSKQILLGITFALLTLSGCTAAKVTKLAYQVNKGCMSIGDFDALLQTNSVSSDIVEGWNLATKQLKSELSSKGIPLQKVYMSEKSGFHTDKKCQSPAIDISKEALDKLDKFLDDFN